MMSLIPSDRTRTKLITVFAQPPMYAHWRPDSQNVAKMLMVSSPKYVSHDIGQWSSLSLKSRIIGADFLLLCILLALTAIILITLAKGRKNSVYLLEFACYRGPKSLECTHGLMTYGYRTFQLDPEGPIGVDENSFKFQEKIFRTNGISGSAFSPPWMHDGKSYLYEALGGQSCFTAALREARMVLFGVVKEVLERTGVDPIEIDYLIINSSLFNPNPSMTLMVSDRFGMRKDVQRYNLSGMGCSAGIISIDLARTLLKTNNNKYVLILCTENTTQNWYKGADRDKQIPNLLFRMGAAATLLTNKATERRRCKYVLEHIVRVHQGADPISYRCVQQVNDSQGIQAVQLSKDIVKVAALALQKNLTILAPLVLPYTELLRFLHDAALQKLGLRRGKAYQPDFRRAFQHFSLHAGGRGVIEGLGSQLKLSKKQLEPSFSSLYFYGNTSSASYFYGMGYAESKQGIHKGDRVWQVGFGSGFKVNSAVWKSLKTFKDPSHAAWKDVKADQIATMWSDLELLSVKFVDGMLLPYGSQKKAGRVKDT